MVEVRHCRTNLLERERIYAQFLGRPALPTAGARAGDPQRRRRFVLDLVRAVRQQWCYRAN